MCVGFSPYLRLMCYQKFQHTCTVRVFYCILHSVQYSLSTNHRSASRHLLFFYWFIRWLKEETMDTIASSILCFNKNHNSFYFNSFLCLRYNYILNIFFLCTQQLENMFCVMGVVYTHFSVPICSKPGLGFS